MFSTFDLIILVLCIGFYIFAIACLLDSHEGRNKKMEYLTLAIPAIIGFTTAMYWLRAFYFESKAMYWFCLAGCAIIGYIVFIFASGTITGIIALIFKEIFKLDFEFPNSMAEPCAIISLVFSFILLGINIYKFPKIMAQTEIEYNENQLLKAKEKEMQEEKSKEFHDALMYKAICDSREVMLTIPSEQSYKYKCIKLKECKGDLKWAYMFSSESTIKRLIKDASQYVDNGISSFYTNVYNWAKIDARVMVDTFLLEFKVELGDFSEISIKTDGSYDANQKLIMYLDGINIYIDSALVCIEQCDKEYQRIMRQREFRLKEKERILQEQREKEERLRAKEEAIADSIRREKEMQETYKLFGGKERYEQFIQNLGKESGQKYHLKVDTLKTKLLLQDRK